MSLMLTYKAIYSAAQAVASKMSSQIQISKSNDFTNRDGEVTTKPLDFDEVPIFNTTTGYGNAILPGVLILILQQTLLLGIGLSAGTARETNRFQNLVPIQKHYNGIFRIVLGKSAAYFSLYIIMAAYITLCVPRMFHYISLVSAQTIIGLMVPYLLAVIFFGMTLSCLVRYRENVMLLVIFTSVPLLFMTGISWPQSNMPWFWQAFAWIFPSTFGIRGFLRISSMGASLQDIQVEYQALWLQTLIYFFTACLVYRYQIILSHKRARARLKQMAESRKNWASQQA
jgi:ABC-2 type transport system permease protein